MTLTTKPLPFQDSVGPKLRNDKFGAIVEGVQDLNHLTPEEEDEITDLLFKHDVLCFKGAKITPKAQLYITNMFDKKGRGYGHGDRSERKVDSILVYDSLQLVNQPEVQLLGSGQTSDPHVLQGLPAPSYMKHSTHKTFHKDLLTPEEMEKGYTRFYRWHIDCALYEKDMPVATTLYSLVTPEKTKKIIRYDDGSGSELPIINGATVFCSGKLMFDILPAPLKSLAVRGSIKYAPHPYSWIRNAKSNSVGFGMVSEGKEIPLDQLDPWEEKYVQTHPMLWRNPVTGGLHFQVHSVCAMEMHIKPVSDPSKVTSETLYPEGAVITDLQTMRDLLYKMQRPAISPEHVYWHEYEDNDFVLFHNRGVMHCVTGDFKPEEVRALWQCNIAASFPPLPPTEDDVKQYE